MATQNTDLKEAKKDAIMTPDMYRSMFLRQFTSQCSQSYDKMMAMGFMYTIQKPLRKIYPNDDDYYAALDRHTEFFNHHASCASVCSRPNGFDGRAGGCR